MKRFALISLMILSLGLAFALSCYDVQYTETAGADGTYPTPYLDQTVTVTGVVTANMYGTSSSFPQGKFFISDVTGGPWSGLYVYRFGTGVAIGDIVNVTGKIIEYYGMTEVAGTSPTPTIQIISSGNPLPAPALIQTSALQDPAVHALGEQWESVLCEVRNVTVTATPNSYQEFYVTDGSAPGQIDNTGMIYSFVWSGITIGQFWGKVVGNVDYSYDVYGLCPRATSDLYPTAVEDNVVILPEAKLIGNFPNPFVGSTEIAFNLKSVQPVQINVYNLKGQKVRTLVNGIKAAQLHNVTFDGKDDNGKQLSSGIYMYKMTAGNSVQTRKMVIR